MPSAQMKRHLKKLGLTEDHLSAFVEALRRQGFTLDDFIQVMQDPRQYGSLQDTMEGIARVAESLEVQLIHELDQLEYKLSEPLERSSLAIIVGTAVPRQQLQAQIQEKRTELARVQGGSLD